MDPVGTGNRPAMVDGARALTMGYSKRRGCSTNGAIMTPTGTGVKGSVDLVASHVSGAAGIANRPRCGWFLRFHLRPDIRDLAPDIDLEAVSIGGTTRWRHGAAPTECVSLAAATDEILNDPHMPFGPPQFFDRALQDIPEAERAMKILTAVAHLPVVLNDKPD